MTSPKDEWKPRKPSAARKVVALVVIFAMLSSGAAAAIALVLQ
ncbi:hypothetical protein JOD55_001575 [Arcanobacterium pluranimalium]|nr:hypothetical protein [Arcanobacterium pluranimalium]MBM7825748.1 hypothetical protein [Arcanobacterium pluranimalium]